MRQVSARSVEPAAKFREERKGVYMEFILLINLAFSVVGFFFIIRMWREVKSRRDEYGERFTIPRGDDYSAPAQPVNQTVDMQQLAALVAQNVREPEPKPNPEPAVIVPDDGDLNRIVAAVMAAQKGGA